MFARLQFPSFYTLNRFLEDSCVQCTLAYLLTRGTLLTKLFKDKRSWREQISLAIVFGLIGASEFIFPGDRYPYVPYTLAASLAGYTGGMALGLLTALVIDSLACGSSFFYPSDASWTAIAAVTLASALIGGAVFLARRVWEKHLSSSRLAAPYLMGAVFTGACGELPHVSLAAAYPHLRSGLPLALLAVYNTCSNGFGSAIFSVILQDAHSRQASNARLVHAQRELAQLRLAQLDELQARLHPHFLFNALAGIAGLCLTNSILAERSISDLAELLRHFLRAPVDVSASLQDELALVRGYLGIERLRLGDRLCVVEDVPQLLFTARVPRFSLQVLVENAVQHGIAPIARPATIRIAARRRKKHDSLFVIDDGVGIARNAKLLLRYDPAASEDRPHGLVLLRARIDLAYAGQGRIRVFSQLGRGSICVVWLPRDRADTETSLPGSP